MKTLSPITTNILRESYNQKQFAFGNSQGKQTVVLIGSCRIVPFLNYLRVYNELNGHPFQLLCFNPVEMWQGPGHEVSEGVNKVMEGYKFGRVDYLLCEHVQRCGVINTFCMSQENIFDSLGCRPKVEIRLPNWNDMHIFDAETAMHDKTGYATWYDEVKTAYIRNETQTHKERFLSHCRQSSFQELEAWVESHWLNTRLGWTSSHPSLSMIWTMFERAAAVMGLRMSEEFVNHPICKDDLYGPTGVALTPIDYAANGWQY